MRLKKQIKEVKAFFELIDHDELSGVKYITRLDEFISTHPKNAYAHFLKGQKTENIQYIDKAIRIYPEYFDAYLLRGKILKKKKYKSRAFDDFKTVLKLINKTNKIDSSELAEIYSFLAEYETEISENLSKAFEYVGKALETISRYYPSLESKYYFQRARLYLSFLNKDLEENKLNNALKDLNTSIELDPVQNQLYLVRGNVKLKLGDKEGYENDIELCKNELFLFQDKSGKNYLRKTS